MIGWVPLFALIGWVGLCVHNVADLPGHPVLIPESLLPLLLTCVLVVLWVSGWRLGAAWGLLAWASVNLVGAITTVLPLSVLPFEPAQTLSHYAFHLVYGLTQLPLLVAVTGWLRRRGLRARRGIGDTGGPEQN